MKHDDSDTKSVRSGLSHLTARRIKKKENSHVIHQDLDTINELYTLND